MNAYELADEIDKAITDQEFATAKSEKWHKEIANMLRKQEYLKLALYDSIAILEAKNKQQADRIVELEKEIDTYKLQNDSQIDTYRYEPVAWIANDAQLPLKEDGSYWLYPTGIVNKNSNYIPLYTTPQTKPLSDEEIVELVNKHIDYVSDDDGGMMVVGVNDLCRAIEAKVRGEK